MVATFTLHEGQPGHHLQRTVQQNFGDEIPKFAQFPLGGSSPSNMISSYSAFSEGWGLYSEYLGTQLGVYPNEPMKELGYIMGDLLRSARLVVDTGIHKYGWSRENAVGKLKNSAKKNFDKLFC